MDQGSIHKVRSLANPFYKRPFEKFDLAQPSAEKIEEIFQKTQPVIQERVGGKTSSAYCPYSTNRIEEQDQFIKFTSKTEGVASSMNTDSKVIRITQQFTDPINSSRFDHKRVPRGAPSPPRAILHSPPRKLSHKDQINWKIPPCISNWKNAKGHTIPIHMRLMADGRNIQEKVINKRFSGFAEAL